MIKKILTVSGEGHTTFWLLEREWNFFDGTFDYFLVQYRDGVRTKRLLPKDVGESWMGEVAHVKD